MRPVFICGLGAVSPAGWGVPALRGALDDKKALPIQSLARPGSAKPLRVREVPNPVPRPALLSHPRLRRTSPISHYAAAAATEAFASVKNSAPNPPRLGLVLCLYCGCIQHSYRFFDEALKDPATASPLIFPETVFAAPASHLAALFHKPVLAQTLLGDPATMLQGVALAADWLMEDRVDLALVIGAEETNWLLADALWHFDHHSILAGGAGALCLSTNPGLLPWERSWPALPSPSPMALARTDSRPPPASALNSRPVLRTSCFVMVCRIASELTRPNASPGVIGTGRV